MNKAGRPYNSITPAWRSKPAIKVCAYKLLSFLNETEPSKSGCSRDMALSRTTVIKWWDAIDWEKDFEAFELLFFSQAISIEDQASSFGIIASECGIPLEKALLMEEIRKEYVSMKAYRSKEYDLNRVRVVGFWDYYWSDRLYYRAIRKNRKAVGNGKRRWKR